MKSVTVELLYVISSPIYKSPYVVLNLNTSFSFLPKADITLDPKPVYFSHFTPKVLQHFPYIISVLFIYSLDKPAEDIQLHKYLSILSHLFMFSNFLYRNSASSKTIIAPSLI